jgi:hypothetical protein
MKVCSLVVLAVSLLVGGSTALAEPLDGTVSGQVLNKTNGGGPSPGVTVTLIAFGRKEQAPLGQQSAKTDDSGRYTFSNLDRDPNVVYLTIARFGSVNYPGETPFQLQEQPNVQTDINIYDTTTSDDGLQIERLNLLVLGAEQGMLRMMEMGALVNTTDRTFVTANPQDQAMARAVKFALPKGALNVQMQTGFSDQDVIPGVGGVMVTAPLLPGRHEFALSFQVPYTDSADLTMQVPYQTGAYSVYLPDTGLRLETDGLTSAGSSNLGGQAYALNSATNVSKATLINSRLSGLGGGSTQGLATNQLAMISLGVVLFVLGGGVLLFGARVRPAAQRLPEQAVDLEQERLELVVRLAALDERFASGQVGNAQYQAERTRGKERLRQLLLAQRAVSS